NLEFRARIPNSRFRIPDFHQCSLAPSCICLGLLRMLVMLAKFLASRKFNDPGRLNAAVLVRLNASARTSNRRSPPILNCLATPRSSCRHGGPVTWLRVPPSGLKSAWAVAVTGVGFADAAGLE